MMEDVATREALSVACTRQPEPREGQAGPAGWRRGPQYWRRRAMPAEGRGLRCGEMREGRKPAGVALPITPPGGQRLRIASRAEAKGSDLNGSMSSRRDQARRCTDDAAGGRMAAVQRLRMAGRPAPSIRAVPGFRVRGARSHWRARCRKSARRVRRAGDWKRGQGNRTEARSESDGHATGP